MRWFDLSADAAITAGFVGAADRIAERAGEVYFAVDCVAMLADKFSSPAAPKNGCDTGDFSREPIAATLTPLFAACILAGNGLERRRLAGDTVLRRKLSGGVRNAAPFNELGAVLADECMLFTEDFTLPLAAAAALRISGLFSGQFSMFRNAPKCNRQRNSSVSALCDTASRCL